MIGEGGSGEVYRAWDPRLHRQVALKLRRKDAPSASSARWIEEARRLAGIRHPNVLVIHGTAVHDERAGIWTELIEGCTLAEWVHEQGRLGAREAAVMVMDICLALVAVHASGLVHGDVKASNVMRESGGRLLLMDFGSGHRVDDPGASTHSGTPLISAPEVLDGSPASVASDVYALGVLLYWLVSCEYPVEADTLEQLRERQRAGSSIPLTQRRPDLPRDFVRIVERALERDPGARWESPSELEGALAALLSGLRTHAAATTAAVPKPSRFWMMVGLPVFGLGMLFVWWSTGGMDAHRGQAGSSYEQVIQAGREIAVELGMVQVVDGGLEALAPGSMVAPGMRLGLELNCSEPAHVYVLNEDERGELFVLFPVDGVDLSNPLEADRPHVLPGSLQGRQQSWVVTSAGGAESFLAVVSRQPLPAIETAIAEFRRASSDRTVEHPSLADGLIESLRGVGGMADAHSADSKSGGVLEEIASSLIASSEDPEKLWVWRASFPNPRDDSGEDR